MEKTEAKAMIRLMIIPRCAQAPTPALAAKLRLVMAVHEIEDDDDGESGPVVAGKFEMEEMEVVR